MSTARQCYSHRGNLHLTLILTFEHLLSQAIYSLGKHLEYLTSYILKEYTAFLQEKSKVTCLPLPAAFSPKHSFLPLVLIPTWKEVYPLPILQEVE